MKSENKENPQQEGAKGAKPRAVSPSRSKGNGLQSPEPRGANMSESQLSLVVTEASQAIHSLPETLQGTGIHQQPKKPSTERAKEKQGK